MTDLQNIQDTFVIDAIDSKIWNWDQLVEFLLAKQGQHVKLEIQEGLCLQSAGVYNLLDQFQFKSVTIYTLNMVEHHVKYKIVVHPSCVRYFTLTEHVDYSQYHMWNQQKLFGAIYARPIWSRIGLASHLYANHRTKTLLNFRTGTELGTDRKTFELEKLFEIDPAGVQKFFSYYDRLPICIEEQDTYTLGGTMTAHTDQLKQFYCNFLIDIVAETFSQGRSFYPTEKTTRPMLLKKPFIVHGPKCFLIHLRQMGFRTFHEFWDEDYDGYGPEHKYHKILELIDTIADMSAERLTDMYAKMQPILDHNYNLLIEQSYRNAINYVE